MKIKFTLKKICNKLKKNKRQIFLYLFQLKKFSRVCEEVNTEIECWITFKKKIAAYVTITPLTTTKAATAAQIKCNQVKINCIEAHHALRIN